MDFEFDEPKSAANRDKHGIDFLEAQALWLDENRIVFPAKSEDEPRFVPIAGHEARHWVASYTLRETKIRLISVRRARENEKVLYKG